MKMKRLETSFASDGSAPSTPSKPASKKKAPKRGLGETDEDGAPPKVRKTKGSAAKLTGKKADATMAENGDGKTKSTDKSKEELVSDDQSDSGLDGLVESDEE
jgi:hypothetical protein